MLKATIITPVYNVEDCIKCCLESISAQSMRDFEVILVDDGSTDGSGKICDEYAKRDKRFRVIHQKNAGVSAARNRALHSAKGTYITFLDSDDAIGKRYLENLIAQADAHNSDVVVSPILKFRDEPQIERLDKGHREVTSSTAILNLLYGKCNAYWGGPAAKLYRASIIKGLYFREDLKYSEDFDFFYRVIKKAEKILELSYAGFMYRIRPGSATQAGFKSAFMDYDLEREKLIATEPNRDIRRAWQSKMAFRMVYYLSVMDKQKDKKYWNTAKTILKHYRFHAIFDKRQKWDQKLTIMGTIVNTELAARMLKWARSRRIDSHA
jgi:glycosyltransferase involved in cell wall biosynthesis